VLKWSINRVINPNPVYSYSHTWQPIIRRYVIWAAKGVVKQITYKDYYLLGYNAVLSFESQPTFRRNTLPPYSGWNKQSKTLAWKQVTSRLVSCPAYSTLKMEAMCSSKTSVDFHWTTRRYILKNSTLHNHRYENLKSYILHICQCKLKLHFSVRNKFWVADIHCIDILESI
jgi:hypothetical protein